MEANSIVEYTRDQAASGFTNAWGETRESTITEQQSQQQAQLARQITLVDAQTKAWSTRFFWIAGLSLVNSIGVAIGVSLVFVVGLGITQLIDGFGEAYGPPTSYLAPIVDLGVAGMFVAFGMLARKGYTWAFVVGMAIYALDAMLYLLVQDWLAIGFHGLFLFYLFQGLRASTDLAKLKAQQARVF